MYCAKNMTVKELKKVLEDVTIWTLEEKEFILKNIKEKEQAS